MSKTTIGHFEDTTNKKSEGINKKYNIFFRRGYGYRNSTFEIGNHTFGIFFRFGLNNCYVWSIDETPDLIKGYTSMDNFDMSEFLSMIGVDEDKIHWGE